LEIGRGVHIKRFREMIKKPTDGGGKSPIELSFQEERV
jgi:hypothetical protein